MRSCISRVAVDCAPLMPSISGSITSSIFPSPGGTAAFENRSLAARSSASSNGAGIGGGGGGGARRRLRGWCGLWVRRRLWQGRRYADQETAGGGYEQVGLSQQRGHAP